MFLRLLAVALLSISNCHAALIDYGDFFHDTESGLDWLKLPSTLNRSALDVSGELNSGGEFDGWRYTSLGELESLWERQGLTANAYCSDGNKFCGFTNGVEQYEVAKFIVEIFGDSHEYGTYGTSTDTAIGIQGHTLYGGSLGTYSAIWASLDNYPGQALVGSILGQPGVFSTNTVTGHFLVRASIVPVPPAVWLFGSALAGLGWVRRRKIA